MTKRSDFLAKSWQNLGKILATGGTRLWVASVLRPMQKKRKNPKASPSEFAYVRAALGLALVISSCAINALVFSMSKHIRIEQNNYYSVVSFFFALNLRAKLLFLVELTLSLIIIYQNSYIIFFKYIRATLLSNNQEYFAFCI